MKGQDFNGASGIGGIVKILMEGRGMRLPEIKELFGNYLDDSPSFVRDQEAAPPVINPSLRQQITVHTPYDTEHLYLNSDGEVLCLSLIHI